MGLEGQLMSEEVEEHRYIVLNPPCLAKKTGLVFIRFIPVWRNQDFPRGGFALDRWIGQTVPKHRS